MQGLIKAAENDKYKSSGDGLIDKKGKERKVSLNERKLCMKDNRDL